MQKFRIGVSISNDNMGRSAGHFNFALASESQWREKMINMLFSLSTFALSYCTFVFCCCMDEDFFNIFPNFLLLFAPANSHPLVNSHLSHNIYQLGGVEQTCASL